MSKCPENIKQELKKKAYALGFDLVGITDASPPSGIDFFQNWLKEGHLASMEYMKNSLELRRNPSNLLPGVRSILAVGQNYYQPNPLVLGQPHIARYALGRDYHKVVRKKLKKLAASLEEEFPEEHFRVCVDSAPIFEKQYAQRAGLGWQGKHTCLINTYQGSWFFIGLLLMTLELKPDPSAAGSCGRCTKCIDACPTGAIIFQNERWQVNAGRCISYLTIEHKGEIDRDITSKIGEWTFGCDICQEVCPFNQPKQHQPLRSIVTKEPDFLNQYIWPSLEEFADLSYEKWDYLTKGSPVRRAGLEGITRNAKINLENLNS